jgi:C-terminal processing protease CtpA/Prc
MIPKSAFFAVVTIGLVAGLVGGCRPTRTCPPATGGAFVDPEIQALSPADREADLEYLVTLLETSYAHREEKERQFGVRPREVADEVRPALLRAENRYQYQSALDEMLLAFHDGHLKTEGYSRTFASTYRSPRARPAIAPRPTPVMVGVGLSFRLVEGRVVITRVRPGSPGDRAGLRSGDVVHMAGDVAALARLGSSLRWRSWARLEAGLQFAADRLMVARPWYPDTPRPRERLVLERGGRTFTVLVVGDREPDALERDFGLAPARCGAQVLRVGTFTGAPSRLRPHLDRLLAQARRASMVVVDLRGNRGGNRGVAHHLASHLIRTPVVAGHHRFLRSAVLQARVPLIRTLAVDSVDPRFTTWIPDRVEPAGREAPLRIAALIDEVCASACEMLARILGAAPGARLYGRPTAGSSGLPVSVPLPRSRLLVSLPSWQARTAQGRLLEGNGVEPHVTVPLRLSELQAGRDPILDRALDDACASAAPSPTDK